jgi:outer membrane protein assembly factor BamB/tetratricopeptide (TPR) repeat protein
MEPGTVGASLTRAEPLVAAVVDGVVYTQWFCEVGARDLYTGRKRWEFRIPNTPRHDSARTHGSLLACPAVAGGLVFAPLQVWPPGDDQREFRFAQVDIIPRIPVRRLFALDAATGAPVWSHQDPRPAGDPFARRLRYLNVTSSPLVLGDAVIVAGAAYRQPYEAWAFAADRATGRVRWTTYLGNGQQEQNLFGRPIREAPVAAVASDGERLFVQTNLGFVSCLDAATGHPLWTRGYDQVEVPLYENLWSTPEREFTWTGSPPVAAGGLVICAPADGPDLVALTADRGVLKWKFPHRDGPRFESPRTFRLLGADDERVYLAGTTVRALEIATGRIAWEERFPGERNGEQSGGRGVIGPGRIYVPSDRGVYALDARAGGKMAPLDARPRAPGEARDGVGNLVATDGAAVLVRLERIEGFFRAEDVRARASALLRDRPGSVAAMLEAARILLAADRVEDALPLLEQAERAVPSLPAADRARRAAEVRGQMLAALEKRATALLDGGRLPEARDAWIRAAASAPDGVAAAAALLRGALALHAAGRADLAAALLEEAIARHGDAVLEDDEDLLPGDEGRCTAASYALHYRAEWEEDPSLALAALQRAIERPPADLLFGSPARDSARRGIDSLLALHGEEIYAPLERQALAALEGARGARDPARLAAVAARWPNSRAARLADLEEGRVRLSSGDAAGAVAAARRILAGRREDEDAAAALWLLSEGLLRSGKVASARGALQRLARLFPEALVETGDGPLPAREAAAKLLERADLRAPPPAPPPLPPGPWRTLWSREAPPGLAWRLLEPAGDPVPGGLLFLRQGISITALDARSGEPAWTAARGTFRGLSLCAGGILLFAQDDALEGVDPSTGEATWTVGLPGPAIDGVVVDSLAVLLVGDPDDGDQAWLVAFDPATGEAAWPSSCLVPGGAERLLPHAGAVVVDGTGTAFPVIRVADMAEGALRPFFIRARRDGSPPGEPVPAEGPVLVVRREDGLEAYDVRNGTRAWTWRPPGGADVQSVAAGEGVLACLDGRGALHALDFAAGTPLWSGGAGQDRAFDPSSTALRADGKAVYAASSAALTHEELRIEARALRTGALLWAAPVSGTPAVVELGDAGDALVVKHLAATAREAKSGVTVLDRGTGAARDVLLDDRLAGLGFEAASAGGVLGVAGERIVLARGR